MPHDTPLITTIVAGLVLAFIFGTIANRLRLPPLVGYLIAGVVVGPYTPGFVANAELATELSELGVILLMFGVGLHFSLKDLVSVQAVAVPGALIRIALATAMGAGLGMLFGWPLAEGLLFGLALSVASTVVVLKALQDRHLMDSDKGRITVGWVIVEDIAMVLALVLIPALGSVLGFGGIDQHDPFIDVIERFGNIHLDTWGILGVTVVKLAAFVGLMLVVGRRLIPMLLHFTAHTGSRELFRLAVLAIALGVAAGAAYLFGISLALGAFFAGMILSESELSQRAAQETLPLRDAFAVLFFVSVGMLFDPTILVTDPLPVIGTVAIILVGKAAVTFLTLVLFRRPIGTALVVTAGLAQIGEFSLILATLGMAVGILSTETRDLIVAGAIISILLNPAYFWLAEKLRPAMEARFGHPVQEPPVEPGEMPEHQPADEEAPEPTRLTRHVVLVGYGRVGSVVAQGLKAAGRPFVVVEDADDRVAAARAAGFEVIVGNAASSKVLGLANLEGAQTAVVAIPNAFEAGQAVQQCRHHNSGLFIIARAHSDEEERYLLDLGANQVIMGEREIGLGMVDIITRDTGAVAAVVAAEAVEAALAPVAAAAAAHGPDIFAPAVERPPAETAVVAATSPESLEPLPVSEPVQSAEVITPDFGARHAVEAIEPLVPADAPLPIEAPADPEQAWLAEPAVEPTFEAPEEPATIEIPDRFVPQSMTEPIEIIAAEPIQEIAPASADAPEPSPTLDEPVAAASALPPWQSGPASAEPVPMSTPLGTPEPPPGHGFDSPASSGVVEEPFAEPEVAAEPEVVAAAAEPVQTAGAASEDWPAWRAEPAFPESGTLSGQAPDLDTHPVAEPMEPAPEDRLPAPPALASEEPTASTLPGEASVDLPSEAVHDVDDDPAATEPVSVEEEPDHAPSRELPATSAGPDAVILPEVIEPMEDLREPLEPEPEPTADLDAASSWDSPATAEEVAELPALEPEPATPAPEPSHPQPSWPTSGSSVVPDPWAVEAPPPGVRPTEDVPPAAPPSEPAEPELPAEESVEPERQPTAAQEPPAPPAGGSVAAPAEESPARAAEEETSPAQAAVEGTAEAPRPRPFGPSSTPGNPFSGSRGSAKPE